jgi:hypothetical protein
MLSQATLPVPVPGTTQTYGIDLQPYFVVESGLEDLASLSVSRAHLLLSDLFRVSFGLAQQLDRVERYHNKAKQETDKRKAVIVIDILPSTLKEKGLASNDLTRQAVIDLDTEYQRLLDQQNDIFSTLKFLKNKFDRFEDAIQTVRSIAYNLNATQARLNPNLTMTMGSTENIPVGMTAETTTTSKAYGVSYGKAKYGQEK